MAHVKALPQLPGVTIKYLAEVDESRLAKGLKAVEDVWFDAPCSAILETSPFAPPPWFASIRGLKIDCKSRRRKTLAEGVVEGLGSQGLSCGRKGRPPTQERTILIEKQTTPEGTAPYGS